jgi:hypothetical protein
MDAKRLKFAQQKESEDVIDIGVGESYAGNRRMARSLSRMQFGRRFDLKTEVGRCAEQIPKDGVLGEGDLSLRAGLATECACSHRPTIVAGTIPLGKSAAGGRTKNLYQHLW